MAVSKCEQCKKTCYRSQLDAVHWALKRSRVTGKALRVYKCPKGKLHLTSWTQQA